MYTAREIKLGSVVKHVTVDPAIASSNLSPLTPNKITEDDPVYHVQEPGLACVVGSPVYCTMGHK